MLVSVLGAGPRRQGLTRAARHLDAVGAGVRDTQEFHLHPGAAYGCRHAKGRQGAQGLGLGYWQKETQRGEVREGGSCIYWGWMEAQCVR